MRLAHHRLIVNDMTSYIELRLWTLVNQDCWSVNWKLTWLLRWSGEAKQADSNQRIRGILFTPAGKELFRGRAEDPQSQRIPSAMLKALEQEGCTAVTPISNKSLSDH